MKCAHLAVFAEKIRLAVVVVVGPKTGGGKSRGVEVDVCTPVIEKMHAPTRRNLHTSYLVHNNTFEARTGCLCS